MAVETSGIGNERIGSDRILNPVGLLTGQSARSALGTGRALPLAGGPVAFSAVEEIRLGRDGTTCGRCLAAAEAAAQCSGLMTSLTREREPFAGVAFDRPRLVGVVNVTPDSFYDGGHHSEPQQAIERVHAMIEAGADIVDIGGESTRPGSAPVSAGQELARLLPVVEAVRHLGVPISVDTRRARVMKEAISAGASIVNDVTGLAGDPSALATLAASDASVVLMHMKGTPATMQDAPRYKSAAVDIGFWLASRVMLCREAGIALSRIAVDPGIGFGKTDTHNMDLLDRAALFQSIGCAVMFGVSRKSFIGRIAGVGSPRDRLPGTIAAIMVALSRGVQMHRVHDVGEARQALAVWQALTAAGEA